jgi:hypothetical protein
MSSPLAPSVTVLGPRLNCDADSHKAKECILVPEPNALAFEFEFEDEDD